MNILVVFAHPNPKSFGKGIVDTIKNTIEEKGDTVKVRDLYTIHFDPLLKPSDFEEFQSGTVPSDIKVEQDNIRWADTIIFVYPVWWAGMPAMLKGYVDRVFSYGFGYEYVNGSPVGLLKGKRGLFFSTTRSPSDLYEQSGMHNSMKQAADQGIFTFCGMDVINHIFFGAVPHVSDETRKEYLKEVENILNSVK